MSKPAHKSTARTFRLGAVADAHITEIVELLSVVEERVVTDTDAVREALAEYAQKLRKKKPRKASS